MTSPQKKQHNAHAGYARRRKSGRGRTRERGDQKSYGNSVSSRDPLEYPVRLNRFIARAGVCSRREADDLITRGLVAIDEVVITQFGTRVEKGQDVTVRGKRITPAAHTYVLLNKPRDIITTASDEKGRTTVLDLITRQDLQEIGLFPVGRLDRHTRGVLLITNDGKLAHRLMHPSFETEKIYRVKTAEQLTDDQLESLRSGITLEDGPARADSVDRIEDTEGCEVGISIHEGRNRQIRRMFEKLGHDVKRLERIRYAGLTTTGIRSGKWRMLNKNEILRLYKLVDL